MSVIPWRGPNPVWWTLAFALALVAITAAVMRGPSPLATWAALFAVGLAISVRVSEAPPGRRFAPWPWRRPNPVRNTVELALTTLALPLLVLDRLWRGSHDGPIIVTTLLLGSALARPGGGKWGWLNRAVWGFLAGISWSSWVQDHYS